MILPCAGDDLGAVERSHLRFEEIQDGIDGLVRDDAFLDQEGLESFNARGTVGFAIFAVFEAVDHLSVLLLLCASGGLGGDGAWGFHVMGVEIRVEAEVRLGVGGPEFLGLETDAVDRHRRADPVRSRVTEVDVGAVVDSLDGSRLTPKKARQPGVLDRWDIPDRDEVANGEIEGYLRLALGAVAFDEILNDPIVDRLVAGRRHGYRGISVVFLRQGIEFLGGDVALVDEVAGNAAEPFLVVSVFEVVEGVERFRTLAQVRPGPDA